jgi:hypothetical protein
VTQPWPGEVHILQTKRKVVGQSKSGIKITQTCSFRNWLNPFYKELGGFFSPWI